MTIETPALGYAKITQRIAAFCYDFLLYLAVLVIASGIGTIFISKLKWFSSSNPIYSFIISIVLPIVFFGWFWTRGGQTLSMRSWKIRIEKMDGSNISWLQTILRLLPLLLTIGICIFIQKYFLNAPPKDFFASTGIALLSVGTICMLWSLVSKKGQGLNDIIAGTRVIQVERGYVPPKNNGVGPQ